MREIRILARQDNEPAESVANTIMRDLLFSNPFVSGGPYYTSNGFGCDPDDGLLRYCYNPHAWWQCERMGMTLTNPLCTKPTRSMALYAICRTRRESLWIQLCLDICQDE